jgi:hypothetical protein
MAAPKKTTAAKTQEATVVAPKAEEKTTKVAAAPVAEKKKAGRKPAEKKTETAAAPAAKKAVKTTSAPLTVNLSIQFAGKSYTQEDFAKMAKDVWQYDLGKSPADLATADLYVKPEESMVYYVFNGQDLGGFPI